MLLGDALIGPFCIANNISLICSSGYKKNTIKPLIEHTLEYRKDHQGNLALDKVLLQFQLDESPPHYAAAEKSIKTMPFLK